MMSGNTVLRAPAALPTMHPILVYNATSASSSGLEGVQPMKGTCASGWLCLKLHATAASCGDHLRAVVLRGLNLNLRKLRLQSQAIGKRASQFVK